MSGNDIKINNDERWFKDNGFKDNVDIEKVEISEKHF